MSNSCKITKTCCVCLKDKHNLEFHVHSKGRTSVKPYCKSCKPIYEGIKSKLINPDIYIGLDFDTTQLKPSSFGFIVQLFEDGRHEKISLDYAKRLVQQGAAYVVSESVVEMILERATNNQDLRFYVKERDKNICHYCEGSNGYTVDHIIPRWRGGLDTPLNLACSCETCNQLKDRLSKSTFLKKKKKGLLETKPFHLSWQEFKTIPKTKTCHCCKKTREKKYYEKQSVICGKCKKFEKALALGFLSVKQLSRIHSGVKRLKERSTYDLFDHNGSFLKRLSYQQARNASKKAIVHIDSKEQTLHLLFNPLQLKRLFPSQTLENILFDETNRRAVVNVYTVYQLFDKQGQRLMNIRPDLASKLEQLSLVKSVNDRLHFLYSNAEIANRIHDPEIIKSLGLSHELLSGSHIGLYDGDSKSICTVTQEVASRLWRNQLVFISKKNRITLKSNIAKSKLNHYLLINDKIEVLDSNDAFYKHVTKNEALQLIQTEQAHFVFINRVQLNQMSGDTLEPKFDPRSLTESSYRLYSQQDLFIGHVDKDIAIRLIENQMAEIQNKTDIALTVPLSQARVKEPSLISIKIG